MIVYLARHATPDWTRHDIPYDQPPGPPLTEQGLREAESLGAFLLAAGVSKIYSSPLERCLQTANIANSITGAPIEVLPELSEVRPGESDQEITQRVQKALNTTMPDSVSISTIAMITHGSPVMFMLGALGMEADMIKSHKVYDHGNVLPPAGAWEAVRDDSSQGWILKLVFVPDGRMNQSKATI